MGRETAHMLAPQIAPKSGHEGSNLISSPRLRLGLDAAQPSTVSAIAYSSGAGVARLFFLSFVCPSLLFAVCWPILTFQPAVFAGNSPSVCLERLTLFYLGTPAKPTHIPRIRSLDLAVTCIETLPVSLVFRNPLSILARSRNQYRNTVKMTETASAPETGATAIADLPTGEPIPTSTPTDSKTSKPAQTRAPRTSLAALLKTLPSNTDAFLSHLQRCLATPSGVDTLLLFICYTSRFTGAALANVSQSILRRSVSPRELVALAFTLPDKTAVVVEAAGKAAAPSSAIAALVAQLAGVLGARLKSLGGLASEARTIARLWALVGMYFWAKRLVLNLVASARSNNSTSEKAAAAGQQGESKLATLLAWAQLLSCGAFQVLENGAYLSGRGVLGWTPAQQGRAYVVGARFLGFYTALELGRLLAEFAARRGQDYSEASAEEQAEVDAMRRSLAINMAWAPLTVHWSMEKGFLTDLVVGAGGCIPGVIQMRKLWRETA